METLPALFTILIAIVGLFLSALLMLAGLVMMGDGRNTLRAWFTVTTAVAFGVASLVAMSK